MSEKISYQPKPENEGNKEMWLSELKLPSTRNLLIGHIIKMRVSPEDAEELTQQTILKAMVAVRNNRFRGEATLKNWLHRIATNETINFLRQKQRRPETDSLSTGLELPSEQPTSEEKYISAEAAQNLRSHFDTLTPKMRELMELLAEGLTLTEIAKRLDTNYMTISNRYFRARKLLKESIQKKGK